MKYALLQQEIGEQIKIIDNSTALGKKHVDTLCIEGYKLIGYLESEQKPNTLLRGFYRDMESTLDEKRSKLIEIRKILDK